MTSFARPHPPRQRLIGLATASVLVPALVLLGGCTSPMAATGAGSTEIVVGLTATANEPRPALSEPLAQVLRTAIHSDHGTLQVLLQGDGRAVPLPGRDLVLRRGSEVEHDSARRERLSDGLLAGVDTVLRGAGGGTGRLDLLGLLTEVGRRPGDRTAVLVSSGLQTTAPVDLATLGWEFDPAALADEVVRRGFGPDLAGKDVTFVGLGQVAGPQRPLPTPLRERLEGFWLALCARSGARACRVDDAPLPVGAPVSPVPAALVPVPSVESVATPTTGTAPTAALGTTTLPTALLFEPESAVLVPGAQQEFAPIARALAEPDRSVSLVGHTASVGPADGARALSRARAAALADALVGLGVAPDRIRAVDGVGYDEPLADDRDGTGALVPEAASLNRAVVATVRGATS